MSDENDDTETIEIPTLLSEKIRAVTNEGHFATLIAALGKRIGEIHADLSEDDTDRSFDILGVAIEIGQIAALNDRDLETKH